MDIFKQKSLYSMELPLGFVLVYFTTLSGVFNYF